MSAPIDMTDSAVDRREAAEQPFALRNKCTTEQLRAHALLDRVRAGLSAPPKRVTWALLALGEPA